MQQPYYPPPGYYPPPPRSSSNTWWIVLLVVLGSVVLIGGILAVLAIAGVRKYLAAAKSAEARSSLSEIAMDASSAYEREDLDPTTLALVTNRICPSASVPVPASDSMVSGMKYQAAPGEWDADGTTAGFGCLKFEMYSPQYYQYNYQATGKGSRVGDSWTATARGDMDGDGTFSTFSIGGHVLSKGVLVNDPTVKESDPTE